MKYALSFPIRLSTGPLSAAMQCIGWNLIIKRGVLN